MPRDLEAQYSHEEVDLRDSADTELEALAVFRATTGALAWAIGGSENPQPTKPVPPSWYLREALLRLSITAPRTARALLAVVTSGYEPEAAGLKRRLSETYARVAAVIEDTSGQHTRQWLEGKQPSTERKLAGKFASLDLFDLYSQMDHADARGIAAWLTVPIPDIAPGRHGLVVNPHRRPDLANALLAEAATELREIANIMAKSRGRALPDRDELDADLRGVRARLYDGP